MTKQEQIISNLKMVYDPEISVNIYDLGLIYEVNVDDNSCIIIMSLTSPFCPAVDGIIADVEHAVLSVDGMDTVDVDITFDPQWGPDMMSEEAKLLLGFF